MVDQHLPEDTVRYLLFQLAQLFQQWKSHSGYIAFTLWLVACVSHKPYSTSQMTSKTQDKNSDTTGIAIYGVGKLARLYREFTRESVFTTSRKLQLKPSMGGSFFGGVDKETALCKKSFRAISSLVCRSDEHIEGVLPIGKLFFFRAENQKYYQSRAPQYYRLVKRYFYDLDKNSTGECLWCFFPMVHSENSHLTVGEIGAYVIWFEVPQGRKATVYDLDRFR